MLLGASWSAVDLDDSDDESKFERMKIRQNSKDGMLGLLWLPGDLQSQVKNFRSGEHQEALVDIDRRAASDLPWWFVVDSSDADENVDDAVDPFLQEVESGAANNAGYLLAAMAVGTQSPGALTLVVLTVLGFIHNRAKD